MKRSKENIVSSFFYYMWCRWSQEECDTVFGYMSEHFWEKWNRYAKLTAHGATERFYADLSENYRHLLVERACLLYDGKRDLPFPKENIGENEDMGIFQQITNETTLRNYAETITDIAYEAGAQGFRPSENSRDTIDIIIDWADEFTRKHQHTDWNEVEYLDTIYEFTDLKLKEQLRNT